MRKVNGRKEREEKQDTAYRKEVNAEFRKGAENVFTGGGSAAYQPRDADTKKPGHGSTGKRQAEKVTQAHQETFGQKVQKSGNGQLQEKQTFSEHKGVDSQKGDTRQRESNHASKAKAKKQMYQTTSGTKKSKSPVRSRSRKKSLILSGKAVDLPGRTVSASRRKWRKNSRIRKITTGRILTGSRRKKGNTIKNGYKRNTG